MKSWYIISMLLGILLFYGCQEETENKWFQSDGYRWTNINTEVSFFDKTGFEKKSNGLTGIDFQNVVTDQQIKSNRVLSNGSGVATGDVNGDGLTDIYFCRIDGPNKLYKNTGNFTFKEITTPEIALGDSYSSGAAFADLDGDQDLDLVVTTIGSGNKLFLNKGDGTFKEQKGALKTTKQYGGQSIAIADIDRDGDLDIYITNYKSRSAKDIYPNQRGFNDIVKQEGGQYLIKSKFQEHYRVKTRQGKVLWFELGEQDLLYKNKGDANFQQVPLTSGVFKDSKGKTINVELKDWGLHAKFFDLNNDFYPDLYVSNDFESPDRIWINNKDGTFRAIDSIAVRHTSLSSMSADASDINKDGYQDIFTAEMLATTRSQRVSELGTMIPLPEPVGVLKNRPQYVGNTLMLNRGDLTFANITDYAGIRASNWTWSSQFYDVNLDGYEDIILTTGNYYDVQNMDASVSLKTKIQRGEVDPSEVMLEYPSLPQHNVIFKNNGDLTFEDKSSEWGFSEKNISQGLAMADFDNDGDQDMVINKMNAPAGIFENTATADRIAVRLIGGKKNTQAIGSRITIKSDGLTQSKKVTATDTYLSDSDELYSFAASSDTSTLKVEWYDQTVTTIRGVKKNRMLEIDKKEIKSVASSPDTSEMQASPIFWNVSSMLNHKHHEPYFDDFSNTQELLPYRLSQPGPGISWYDLNNDTFDDLLIGTGKGGRLSVFKNEKGENFISQTDNGQGLKFIGNDASSVIALPGKKGPKVLAGIYNYESPLKNSGVKIYDADQFSVNLTDTLLFEGGEAVGTMASADYDRDGDLDLFVGGRTIPSKFPQPVSSRLFKNNGGMFHADPQNKFEDVGLVKGAVFSDVNGDMWPDLILAREWNSLALYINKKGHFVNQTKEWGLANYQGLWNGVATGDFNNDGRLDIIATNIGQNSIYSLDDSERGISLFYYPENNGVMRVIEAAYDQNINGWAPIVRYPKLAERFPALRNRISSHKDYSTRTIEEMFGIALDNFYSVNANTFSSMIFLNNGNYFEAKPLPGKAQFTTAYQPVISDFNADGNEDVILSQNFFAKTVEKPRSDAGRSLLLLGNGRGEFKAIDGRKSGLKVYGEQRGAAVSDFNNDGRADIVITQNGAQTKLYKNIFGQPGVTVQLQGTESNPDGVGSKVSIIYEDGEEGPLREIKSGSGYLSQNSTAQVLGFNKKPSGIKVIWASGAEKVYQFTGGKNLYFLDHP